MTQVAFMGLTFYVLLCRYYGTNCMEPTHAVGFSNGACITAGANYSSLFDWPFVSRWNNGGCVGPAATIGNLSGHTSCELNTHDDVLGFNDNEYYTYTNVFVSSVNSSMSPSSAPTAVATMSSTSPTSRPSAPTTVPTALPTTTFLSNYTSISGSYPANPQFAGPVYFSDSSCTQVASKENFVLDTCFTNNIGQSKLIKCEN